MSKQTFQKLHPDKKHVVYQAVLKEYLRVPLENVSVKNIVKDANIPRGSFYAYFESTEGALKFLIGQIRTKEEIKLNQTHESLHLFDFFHLLFQKEMAHIKQNQYSTRILLLSQISKSPRAINILFNDIYTVIVTHHDYEHYFKNAELDYLTANEKQIVLNLLFTTFRETLLMMLQNPDDLITAEEEFNTKMAIIQLGIKQKF